VTSLCSSCFCIVNYFHLFHLGMILD
jgi:hypothetical protein